MHEAACETAAGTKGNAVSDPRLKHAPTCQSRKAAPPAESVARLAQAHWTRGAAWRTAAPNPRKMPPGLQYSMPSPPPPLSSAFEERAGARASRACVAGEKRGWEGLTGTPSPGTDPGPCWLRPGHRRETRTPVLHGQVTSGRTGTSVSGTYCPRRIVSPRCHVRRASRTATQRVCIQPAGSRDACRRLLLPCHGNAFRRTDPVDQDASPSAQSCCARGFSLAAKRRRTGPFGKRSLGALLGANCQPAC